MKDIQGIQRGKCNSCECVEYRTPGDDGKYACGYCGHRPVHHVRIVPLGECRTKDCDCDKYDSDDKNSYSDCQYCGCSASTHKGAEACKNTPAYNYSKILTFFLIQCANHRLLLHSTIQFQSYQCQ